jgi:hypothetical protein
MSGAVTECNEGNGLPVDGAARPAINASGMRNPMKGLRPDRIDRTSNGTRKRLIVRNKDPADKEWRPPDLAAIMQEINRREMKSWLQPKSGDLLLDVRYLQGQSARESNAKIKGVFARATIVMAAATIEAVTNDALAEIYQLMTDSVPSECAGEPPWCYFRGRSTRRMASLLRKGSFAKKRDYIVTAIEGGTGYGLENTEIRDIDRLMTFRNRIVHMSFHERPGKYKALLNANEAVHIAAAACETARRYLDLLSTGFSEMRLPIPTIRPYWHFEDDLK